MKLPVDESDTYSQFKGWRDEGFGQYKRHWAAYYRKELDACLRLSSGSNGKPLRLLEIGFGNGGFMGWARDQGHVVFGIEIEVPQLMAAKRGRFKVAESLDALQAEYEIYGLDGAVAFDVFEHLTRLQLEELVKQVRGVLKPGGWILARFPNGDSPFGRINQHGDLTHVTALGSVATGQLALTTGMKLASVRSEQVPIRRIGLARGVINLLRLAVRALGELPFQVLLNAYYPGVPRWYSLAPNLVARLVK